MLIMVTSTKNLRVRRSVKMLPLVQGQGIHTKKMLQHLSFSFISVFIPLPKNMKAFLVSRSACASMYLCNVSASWDLLNEFTILCPKPGPFSRNSLRVPSAGYGPSVFGTKGWKLFTFMDRPPSGVSH